MRVTFVCTGNTCRSPMLMFMFARYAAEKAIDVEVDSAGVKGGGSPLNQFAAETLAERGIQGEEAERFRSKVFDAALAAKSDLVITMTEEQKDLLNAQFPDVRAECVSSLSGEEVDDPYGKGAEAYRKVADLFDGLLKKIAERVCAHAGASVK